MASKQSALPVIGIDVGGTNITGGVVDPENRIVARVKLDTEADKGPGHVEDQVAACVAKLRKEAGALGKRVAGVGLGVPGAVDAEAGIVLEAVNLRWSNVALVERLSPRLKLPITLDNDVNAGTWGEYRIGAARGRSNVLGIFVGTGIGGGLVLGGKLYQGTFGTAGEIGHVWADVHGLLGMRSLEQQASRSAIVNRLVQMIDANAPSAIPELGGKKWRKIRSKVLGKAMAADDPLTLAVLEQAATTIGRVAGGVVTLLSLDGVVIGGGLTEATDERWMGWIRAGFNEAVFPKSLQACEVVASKLGDDAGLLGAALLARDRLE